MLYFREHQWLRINGATRFSARIGQEARTRADVHWTLELRYAATGPIWRRVTMYSRPTVWITLSGFKPELRSWTDLERLNFWNPAQDDDDYLNFKSGFLDISYHPRACTEPGEDSLIGEHVWRVAHREGGFFGVELAGVADGSSIIESLAEQPVAVTPDGREERAEPDADFWKKHAALYLIENVPFGTVTVCVPRNARNLEAYALARARQLIGVGEPEHICLHDFAKTGSASPDIVQDIYVELHFNGHYEH